ncbi:hypothetical protein ACLSZ7_11060, partial [Avibacterium gallinarum]|uniref:hypothetical protein n=1 Tax=Avibacterium gallinarum TaxID=755 RepID=UPI003BF77207
GFPLTLARMQGRFSGKKSVNFSSLLEKSVFLPPGKSDRNEEKQAFRVCFFCLLCFAQAKKSRSPFGRNQSINARRSRSKMKSPFRVKPKCRIKQTSN